MRKMLATAVVAVSIGGGLAPGALTAAIAAPKTENAICRGFRAQGEIYVTDLWTRSVGCGTAQRVSRAFVRTRSPRIRVGGITLRCQNDDFGEGAALASCRSSGRYVSFQYGYL